MMQDIYIVGAGGLAREVAFVIRAINDRDGAWDLRGFVVADHEPVGAAVGPSAIVCTEVELLEREASVAIGIGAPEIIARISRRLGGAAGISFPNLVHPNVTWDSDRIAIGDGNVICAGNVLTTDISIGSFNVLNLSCTYGHDVRVGDHCVVNPGVNVSGGVRIGDGCLVGTGATILQDLVIGESATIGAGAVVTKDVRPGSTVVGVPAKEIGGGR